jgi:hypothetical protein
MVRELSPTRGGGHAQFVSHDGIGDDIGVERGGGGVF